MKELAPSVTREWEDGSQQSRFAEPLVAAGRRERAWKILSHVLSFSLGVTAATVALSLLTGRWPWAPVALQVLAGLATATAGLWHAYCTRRLREIRASIDRDVKIYDPKDFL